MWEKEKAAYEAGKRVQCTGCLITDKHQEWQTFPPKGSDDCPSWNTGLRYRIHPEDDKESNMEFKVGDRVTGTPINNEGYEYCTGYTGTVQTVTRKDRVQVRWDQYPYHDATDGHGILTKHVTKLPSSDSKEVQAALALLKGVGKVEFTPYKPAFKPITVKLNASHNANVSSVDVKVGCQTFTFDAIEALAAAVKAARDYNNS